MTRKYLLLAMIALYKAIAEQQLKEMGMKKDK
jgi:hypothetical protein